MYYAIMNTKWGELTANINPQGQLSGLWFKNQKYFPVIEESAIWIDKATSKLTLPNCVTETFHRLEDQLKQYEDGHLQTFDLPLAPVGTDFRKLVWQALLKVPYGQTSTYGEIGALVAKRMGKDSMSGQAIGGAIGHNPISIIIPCHRIIAKSGSLTGYAGGIDKKSALLKHENSWLAHK